MNPLTRRSFLERMAGIGIAAACSPAATAAPAGVGFRIFACDWTLRKTCDPEAFGVAARIGLDGVQVDFGQPAAEGGSPPLLSREREDRILAASAEHKVPIASLAFGVLNRIPYKRVPETEEWVRDGIAVMQRLRQHVALLAFFGQGDLVDDPAGTAEVIRRLQRLAPRAAELERILDAVNSPAIQVYYDVGNMHKVGEDVGAAIRRLGRERICEVHFKDYDDLYGKGSMDFPAVRRALDAAGYRGWCGIEGVKTPLGVEESIRYDLEYLRPLFPRTL
jgi:L-ribulose-5-phosphate 3-epimerase